jgi:Phage tail tube protein, GTA-gp10
MVNRHRGEIAAELGGKTYTLCLTLGALAEIESAYGNLDLIAIAERFETGRIGASDAIKIIGAGLRGGGTTITNEAVATLSMAGGAVGYLKLTADLLTATFNPNGDTVGNAVAPQAAPAAKPSLGRV